MRKKYKLGIFLFIFGIVLSAIYWNGKSEPYSTETVVDSLWSEFKVQSSQIGEFEDPSEGEPAIYIDVYDKNDIPKVEKHLQDNLSKDDLKKYEIIVFSNKGMTY